MFLFWVILWIYWLSYWLTADHKTARKIRCRGYEYIPWRTRNGHCVLNHFQFGSMQRSRPPPCRHTSRPLRSLKILREPFRRVAVGRPTATWVVASLDRLPYYDKNLPFQHFSELRHFSVCRNTWSWEATMLKIVYVYEDGLLVWKKKIGLPLFNYFVMRCVII